MNWLGGQFQERDNVRSKVTEIYGGVIRWESAFFSLTNRRFGHGSLRFFGGMPVNRNSEACDVIELLTNVKKFCPVENRHEMGRGNQDSSGGRFVKYFSDDEDNCMTVKKIIIAIALIALLIIGWL